MINLPLHNKGDFQYNFNISDNNFDQLTEFDSLSYTLFKGLQAIEKGEFDAALIYGYDLMHCDFFNFKRRGYALTALANIGLKKYVDTCIHIVDCYFADNSSYPFLPLSSFVHLVIADTNSWSKVSHLVDLSIILDIYLKYLGKDADSFRRYAYEDFLSGNSLERPSQLIDHLSKFDRSKIIYYLRFICIEINMDTSVAFEGANDVANERLQVCKQLCELDTENYEVYQQEIKEIIRRQVISSRIQEIDQSRIFIDIPGIKEWANKELKESYLRYISYLKHGITSDIINERKEGLGNSGRSAMSVPTNEVMALLRHIVLELRDSYVSADYGLDRFLSTRIRHGLLENQLRRPIEAHHLITKKETQKGPYLPNYYWLDEFNTTEGNTDDLNRIFSNFSESYDSLIAKLNNEWIQIKSDKKTNGLFDFTIGEELITFMASSITEMTSLNDVLNLVLSKFDTNLQLNLLYVREEFNNKAKREARELLNKLQANIGKFSAEINLSNVFSAINQARTDLQATFDRVIEWFIPSRSGSSTPYTVEDVVSVAEAIIKDGTPNFETNLNVSIEEIEEGEDFLMQGSLPIFVDILANIFDNVVKRSGLDKPVAEITQWDDVSIEDLHIINIKVTNKLGPNIIVSELEKELARKRTILDTGDYSQHLAKDEKSGLFKIRRSINDLHAIGFDVKSKMDFGVIDGTYFISISIPYRIFKLETTDSETLIETEYNL